MFRKPIAAYSVAAIAMATPVAAAPLAFASGSTASAPHVVASVTAPSPAGIALTQVSRSSSSPYDDWGNDTGVVGTPIVPGEYEPGGGPYGLQGGPGGGVDITESGESQVSSGGFLPSGE